ncbi:MAG: TIGR01777 family protein [Elusimicrobia bacterium RIFCSPLOWO2_01_FULL_59_12]|nr:MAG: TIGR01777 family protein [Elusimicrobia bacterium RIFCSPLOWO2_01_FULL_59_12]
MKILMSGSTGLVGSALVPYLANKSHSVTRLVRKGQSGISWNPDAGSIDTAALEGFDAVIHLAGESIASGRWTAAKKQRIRDSRVRGTHQLAEVLTALKLPPRTLLCASAIGFYGDRGEEILREENPAGTGFLAEVCRAWEAAAATAALKGIRVVYLRFGVILSPAGGALAKMLVPFKLGVGGKIGPGNQYMSWIAIDDVLGAVLHALSNPVLKGPVNVVAPDPVTNLAFTKTLGRVLWRPTIVPLPAFAARLAFGEMADELLLASQRVEPRMLHKSGYAFRYPELEGALRHLLNR